MKPDFAGELPVPHYKLSRRRPVELSFGSLNHTSAARDGDIYDELNASTEEYPLLVPRRHRMVSAGIIGMMNGFGSDGSHLYWCTNNALYYAGESVLPLTESQEARRCVCLAKTIVVYPDMVYYNTATGMGGKLGASYSGGATVNGDTITLSSAPADTFKAGDTVHVVSKSTGSESTYTWGVDGWYTITSIVTTSTEIRVKFAGNPFPNTDSAVSTTAFSMEREIPALTYACAVNNRIYGCIGSAIHVCRLGDPTNWNDNSDMTLDASRSDYGETGNPAPFTGCAVYNERPVFFTETSAVTVYGENPPYSTSREQLYGVKAGAADSIVEAMGCLFYLSPHGIVSYTSSSVSILSDNLGIVIDTAVAGSDGRCYYICTKSPDGTYTNYRYSFKTGMWAKEDATSFYAFASLSDRLFGLHRESGKVYMLSGAPVGYAETTVDGIVFTVSGEYTTTFRVDFAPFRDDSSETTAFRMRQPKRLYLRMIRSPSVIVTVSVQYGDGTVKQVASTVVPAAYSVESPVAGVENEEILPIPLPNGRCAAWKLIIQAHVSQYDKFKLIGIARETYTNSK